MATHKYASTTALTRVATNVKSLVNAVKTTVDTVNALAQTASAEAKYYGTCATAAATVAKVVTCSGFKLATGARIAIKFTYACSSATATLNINSTGAKNVQWVGSTTTTNAWDANEVVLFEYDGTNFNLIKSVRLTLANITGTLAIAKGGTGATTAAQALANLGAAASNHTHTAADVGASPTSHKHAATDITSGTLPIARGGTGQTTAAGILSAIGAAPSSHTHTLDSLGAAASDHTHTLAALGAAASSHNHSAANITSGTLPISRGGTGQTTAAGILSAIGAAPASHTHTAAQAGAMRLPENLPSNLDLNTLTAPGFYYSPANATVGTWTNCPTGNSCFIIVGQHAGVYQCIIEYVTGSPKIYFRNYYNGTWGAWARQYSTNDKPTAADVGAAASSHTHTAAQVGAAASTHYHNASNINAGTLAIARGGTGATSAAAACTALGAARRVYYTVNIPTGSWSALSGGGYTKNVGISGVLSSDVPVVGIVLSSDTASAKLQGAAFACINRITTYANGITLYCYGSAPTTAITLQLLILR